MSQDRNCAIYSGTYSYYHYFVNGSIGAWHTDSLRIILTILKIQNNSYSTITKPRVDSVLHTQDVFCDFAPVFPSNIQLIISSDHCLLRYLVYTNRIQKWEIVGNNKLRENQSLFQFTLNRMGDGREEYFNVRYEVGNHYFSRV